MKKPTERQRFERWYKSLPNPSSLERSWGGGYVWYGTHSAWRAWQAAVRSMRARGES